MKRFILQLICSISLTLIAADDTSQAKLLTTAALKHTMKSATFSNDGSKMFGETANSYAVLYDVKKQECQYERLLNDVRSMHYYDDTQELLLCDQHRVGPNAYYMQVIHARPEIGKEDVVYNALKPDYSVFNCSASYNRAKDRILVVEPKHIISVNARSNRSVLLRSFTAGIRNACYVDDQLLLVQDSGNAWLYNLANKLHTNIFQKAQHFQGREWLKSIVHNDRSLLLHTNKRVIKHDLKNDQQQLVVDNAWEVDQALLHPTQTDRVVLLQDRKVLVKDVTGQTVTTVTDPLHRYASRICSIYNNMVLLLSRAHQEVTLCDVEKKQSHSIYKGDSSNGKPLQATLCADNEVQIATDKKILTYDISQLATT